MAPTASTPGYAPGYCGASLPAFPADATTITSRSIAYFTAAASAAVRVPGMAEADIDDPGAAVDRVPDPGRDAGRTRRAVAADPDRHHAAAPAVSGHPDLRCCRARRSRSQPGTRDRACPAARSRCRRSRSPGSKAPSRSGIPFAPVSTVAITTLRIPGRRLPDLRHADLPQAGLIRPRRGRSGCTAPPTRRP